MSNMHVRVYYRTPKPVMHEPKRRIYIHRYDDVTELHYSAHGVHIYIAGPLDEEVFIPYDNLIELQKWEDD